MFKCKACDYTTPNDFGVCFKCGALMEPMNAPKINFEAESVKTKKKKPAKK